MCLKRCILFSLLLIASAEISDIPIKELDRVYEWNNLDFGFPTAKDKEDAVVNGTYTAGFKRPNDVDVEFRDDGTHRVFITSARLGPSFAPYSLATVSEKLGPYGNVLEAYPSFDWHFSDEYCGRIFSAFRVQIDECNRLWVIDSGFENSATRTPITICPPKILAFDLKTDKLVHNYTIPRDQYIPGKSDFNNLNVDVLDPPPNGKCETTKVYLTDTRGIGLVVYDMTSRQSWRTSNRYYYPDPDFGIITINGESVSFMDGVYSINFTPRDHPGPRRLIFHAHASQYEVEVPLDVINNQTLWTQDPDAAQDYFEPLGRRGTQCSAAAMNADGILFGGLINPVSIYAWDSRTAYNWGNFKIAAYNPETLQFSTGLKIRKNQEGEEELWVLTVRLQKIKSGTMRWDEKNFRVQRCNVNALLNNEPCFKNNFYN